MNIQYNSIAFQGKKEVIYGLKNVAELARNYETTHVAYAKGRTPMPHKINDLSLYEASMKAYGDMVAYDDEFVKALNDISSQDVKSLKKTLTPTRTEHGIIAPLTKFVNTLNNALTQHNRDDGKIILQKLISKLQ